MKSKILILLLIIHSIIISNNENETECDCNKTIILKPQEINEIFSNKETYSYFGLEICSIIKDLPILQASIFDDGKNYKNISTLCDYISQGKTTAPTTLINSALSEVNSYIKNLSENKYENIKQISKNLKDYYEKFESGRFDILVDGENSDSQMTRSKRKSKKYCLLKVCRLEAKCALVKNNAQICSNLAVNGNEAIGKNLTVCGSETVNGNLTVGGTLQANVTPLFSGDLKIIGTPQQACILFLDANLAEKARICSSPIPGDKGIYVSIDGGLTQNFRVNNFGGVNIAPPSSGSALTVTGNSGAAAITAIGNGTTTAPALQLLNNPTSNSTDFLLTIDNTGAVKQGTASGVIVNGCQPGPLTIGTSDATSLTLATNGCTSRLSIDPDGAVTIAEPTAGVALTINGGGETIVADDLNVLAGNIILPSANAAETQGIIKLGGTGPTNVNLYEIGTRNFFAGNGSVNSSVTGIDNTSIGTSANNTLTTGSFTIAIGNLAQASGSDSVAIGNNANTTFARAIVLGSRDSTSTGAAPIAGANNAIAIGSANGTLSGANASGLASIAIGGSGGTFSGANASADRAIAVGINATVSATLGIALGSASGTAGGNGPATTNTNAIAVGSANATMPGAVATGASSIAFGGADSTGNFAGATATGDRSIAFGLNANSSASGAIATGSASGTAGGNAPVANQIAAIAIGSGNITRAGAMATGISSIAIGGADGTSAAVSNFPGAVASGSRSIAIGQNATANSAGTIAVGSASTGVTGIAAQATNTSAIAIGSANVNAPGATASGLAAVALGGANGAIAGATASGDRSVAIGNGANTSQADAILLGNAGATAVRVGIGIAAPTAKVHIVGVNGTSVFRMNQVNSAIANAPVWLNPSTSAVAGTPIHYNASNQLFGFTSSARYKKNIRKINSESNVIYNLNPVLYDPKEGYGEGKDIPGFIAEQVHETDPKLAILNKDNQPENVAYNSLIAFAIKEIQNQKKQIEEQDNTIKKQADTIAKLIGLIKELKNTTP